MISVPAISKLVISPVDGNQENSTVIVHVCTFREYMAVGHKEKVLAPLGDDSQQDAVPGVTCCLPKF